VFALARPLAAYRWYVLLHGKAPAVTFVDVVRLVLVSGFVGHFMPGGVGVEILKAYGLAGRTSDTLLSVTSVLVERLFALVALVLLMLIGLALVPALPAKVVQSVWIASVLILGAVLALVVPQFRRLSQVVLSPAPLAPVSRGLEKLYGALDEYVQQRRLMLWSLILALLFQLIRCIEIAIAADALGADLPFMVFMTFVPMVVLITLMPISIGGLGVQDVSFVYLFGLVGMPAEIALPASLLIHILVLLTTAPGAWLYARGGLRS
jgi:glycosyltransferase 2 family protein